MDTLEPVRPGADEAAFPCRHRPRGMRRAVPCLLLGGVFVACGSEPTRPTPVVARVEVSPSSAAVTALGETQAFSAVARDAAGTAVSGQSFTWSSSSASVATVDANGLATAVGSGTATITASTAGVSGSAALAVNQVVSSVDVTAGDTLTALGDTSRFTAVAKDGGGHVISGLGWTWSSSATDVATIDAGGLATALGNGTTTILASAGGGWSSATLVVRQEVARVEVTPGTDTLVALGDTVRLSAVARDANDSLVPDVAFGWGSSSPAVATVNPGGLVVAVKPGQASAWAAAAGLADSAAITVTQVPVRLDVTPGVAALTVMDDTARFEAVLRDANEYPIDGQIIAWSSSATDVATLDDAGLATAQGLGRAAITATAAGISGNAILGVQPPFTSVSAGGYHTCGVLVDGTAYCWGRNEEGELGDGTGLSSSTPVAVAGGMTFGEVEAGGRHTCGVAGDGAVHCWGRNVEGQLGDGTSTNRTTPVAVSGSLTAVRIGAGAFSSCMVAVGGYAHCWGQNNAGQLGDSAYTDRSTPVAVVGGLTFSSVTGPATHTCGLEPDGTAHCWGLNSTGALGTSTNSRATPGLVVGGHSFASIDVEGGHTCGLTTSGDLYCWGLNDYGQLGDGTTTNRSQPVLVGSGYGFVWVSTGNRHTCALTADGPPYCWGLNRWRELGDGTWTDRASPVQVLGGLRFVMLSGGLMHSCGVTSRGVVFCWGGNTFGQLGDGTTDDRGEPVPVLLP